MKTITNTKLLLGIVLLGTALTSVVQTAEARPQRGDKDDNRRGGWRNDDRRGNDRRGNDRYNSRDQHRNRGTRRDQRPYRHDDYGYGNGGYGYGNGGNYGYGNGGNYGYGNGGNTGYGNQSFTGRVTQVDSATEFNIRIGNTTYNVYTDSRVPRGLRVGDIVRVYGTRVGKNDIRNASASLLSNRR